ncbi:fluoride efflux transporter CrcB [Flavobacterium sp.]|uniref:fluoride efflux transporter CrcB n=1 Tax=Flavobacterium sp. TaxID=239 RepID=UPI00286E193B|nr:fluoride efflux transporter CrcB [Flavobacterium sp.]
MKTIIYIAIGGGLGSVLRYVTTIFVTKYASSNFPYATFLTNVLGCLLIGLFFGYFEKQNTISQDLKFFLITGFCGGYTTFSAFSNENIQLLQTNQFFTAILYITLSVFIGLLATWVGLFLVKSI